MKNIEYIGFIAGFLSTIAFLPQVLKIFRTRSTKDISLRMYIIYVASFVTWFLYGYFINSYSIMIANTITLIPVLITIRMKLKWK